MPRPKEWFENGDPITADFTFVRWIGDRKGIEEQTKVWDRAIIDRTENLREWADALRKVSRRVRVIYGYANNHNAGYAPATMETLQGIWSGSQAEKEQQGEPARSGNLKLNF